MDLIDAAPSAGRHGRIIALLLLGCLAGLIGSDSDSPWSTDLDQAVAAAETAGKPLVLFFTSQTCPPCQRMHAELEDDSTARRALRDVVPVLLDVQEHPVLAHRLRGTTTPTVVLLNRQRRIVRRLVGYQNPQDFTTALRVLVLHGDEQSAGDTVSLQAPDLARLAAAADGSAQLAELLGEGGPAQRQAVRQLLSLRSDAAAELWPLLTAKPLGVRVDAAAVLARLLGSSTYDPFAAPDDWAAAAAAWRRQHSGPDGGIP